MMRVRREQRVARGEEKSRKGGKRREVREEEGRGKNERWDGEKGKNYVVIESPGDVKLKPSCQNRGE